MQYHLLWFVVVATTTMVTGSFNTCEKRDGDCPDDCHAAGFNGTLNFVARFNISPFHPDVQQKASMAEKYIMDQGSVQVSCFFGHVLPEWN